MPDTIGRKFLTKERTHSQNHTECGFPVTKRELDAARSRSVLMRKQVALSQEQPSRFEQVYLAAPLSGVCPRIHSLVLHFLDKQYCN